MSRFRYFAVPGALALGFTLLPQQVFAGPIFDLESVALGRQRLRRATAV